MVKICLKKFSTCFSKKFSVNLITGFFVTDTSEPQTSDMRKSSFVFLNEENFEGEKKKFGVHFRIFSASFRRIEVKYRLMRFLRLAINKIKC